MAKHKNQLAKFHKQFELSEFTLYLQNVYRHSFELKCQILVSTALQVGWWFQILRISQKLLRRTFSMASRTNKCTHLNLWVGRKQTQLRRRRAGRERWHWQWSREAGAAWGSGRWCPGRGCWGNKHSKPSASSRGSPSSPTPHSPWSYSDLGDHSPDSKKYKLLILDVLNKIKTWQSLRNRIPSNSGTSCIFVSKPTTLVYDVILP